MSETRESRNRPLHIYIPLIFDKCIRQFSKEFIDLSTNIVGKIGYPYAKKFGYPYAKKYFNKYC